MLGSSARRSLKIYPSRHRTLSQQDHQSDTGRAIVDRDVLSFHVAQVAKTLLEPRETRILWTNRTDIRDAMNPTWPLRLGDERRGQHRPEASHKRAAIHYSIT